jgi:hypothetical protein
MKTVTVERVAPDKLMSHRWVFWYDDRYHALRCSHYQKCERPTTRHKLKPVVTWDQHRRNETNPPVLDEGVKQDAILQFITGVTYKPWEPR